MNRLSVHLLVMGWALAFLFCFLWLNERHSSGVLTRPLERTKALANPGTFPENHQGLTSAKVDPTPALPANPSAVAGEKPRMPTLFSWDPGDRIHLTDDARRALGLSEADAAAAVASTQAYLDMHLDLQRRHLDVRKLEHDHVEFFIDAFPTEGRAILEGVAATWHRYLDPTVWAQVRNEVEGLFGGEKEGFGALSVLVKARRDFDGSTGIITTEQFYTPSGEKASGRTGVSISGEEDHGAVSESLHQYTSLFK